MDTAYKLMLILAFASLSIATHAQVGVGTRSPDSSAVLDLNATDRGLLPPRMTQSQRDAITSPALGLVIFNTTTNCVNIYTGNHWNEVCGVTHTASIDTLKCAEAINNGYLTTGFSTNGVSSVISYRGGNGGVYHGQTIASTGVTGLTAILPAGTLANDAGTLTYNIIGTPTTAGIASFAINIGGQSCILTRNIDPALLNSIDCGSAIENGILTIGVLASGANSVISYDGGNGKTYGQQSIASTGVTGLIATLPVGTLANGAGTLTYTISGTPSSSGIASFAISVGGQSCTLTRAITGPVISTLECAQAVNNGSLISGVAANGVTFDIPYTGGNGGSYATQSIPSSGLTGLTATLAAGNLAQGSGTLTYTISGTPSSKDTAYFAINIGGQSCILKKRAGDPTVNSVVCNNSIDNGSLTSNVMASGVSSQISYSGGSGGFYAGQTIKSTGVTGLSAALLPGTLASGSGTLTFIISGFPNKGGTASFAINFGGQSCTLTRNVEGPKIQAINCITAINNGVLTSNVAAVGVSSDFQYSGGNGAGYAGQTIGSTGVTGLTATLASGVLANGAGNLHYIISGTPSNAGKAYFALDIGGQSCTLTRNVVNPNVNSIDCKGSVDNGSLTKNIVASGVSSYIPYSGGNGAVHAGQTIKSTGVTGLTATLASGTLANGPGTLTYTISGTPNSWGTASFTINIGGQSCTLTRVVVGPITSIDCVGAIKTGSLIVGTVASGVSVDISYAGGIGTAYTGQSIPSTGVTGLTATLAAGTLNNGAGTFNFNIAGTPTTSGVASFAISFGGQSCTLNINVDGPTVSTLGCSGSTNYGYLTNGVTASGVYSMYAYTGGNGGTYKGQVIASTGVTGLTATLASGTLANGSGTLAYTISGTPTQFGIATFAIDIAGKTCTLTRNVTGLSMANTCNPSQPTVVVEVINATTGKIWMDRNLGAHQKATNATDAQSYGSLFQWGRAADGHQCVHRYVNDGVATSSATTFQATTALPNANNPSWDGLFISNNNDWLSTANNNLWQGINSPNNPCPGDFRLPTQTELNAERLSWSSSNSAGAYASPLKWTMNGWRDQATGGQIKHVGGVGIGHYWSSTLAGSTAEYLFFGINTSGIGGHDRANGLAVRCIKDLPNVSISSMDCGGATHKGSLTTGTVASAVSSEISYTGGNGSAYKSQSIASTGVTGLTATIAAGTFSNGPGNLTLIITGTPSNWGVASFAINIGGQSCTLKRSVHKSNLCSSSNPTAVVEVINSVTGKIWMDRNLGAHRKATSATDAQAYGSLFQWGRGADGHECVHHYINDGVTTSATTNTQATTVSPNANNPSWDGLFITNVNDWLSSSDDNLWQGANGINNPCPIGYRLPTLIELNHEKTSWGSSDRAGAFASPVKWAAAGSRSTNNMIYTGSFGRYWSSTVALGANAGYLFFSPSFVYTVFAKRSNGYSLRCIKDASSSSLNTINCAQTTNSGFLTVGTIANGVSSKIPYTGGNGAAYSGQAISSTGVTGLTATLSSGTLANGADTLTYTISGTPLSRGTASFAINIGGQSCTLMRNVLNPNISSIDCEGASNTGTLSLGVNASAVSSVLSYSGGNGEMFPRQTISSSGVTGLTATLAAGTLANGAGTLTFTISGTPNGGGIASFVINIGGQSCTLTRNVLTPSINTFECSNASKHGSLNNGTAASGVYSVVTYTGGNGIFYPGQTISSTGVTGLTATLAAGTLANGGGTLTFNISGTPSNPGSASFAINFGGQACVLNMDVIGTLVNTCSSSNPTNIVAVTNGMTGQTWMDRNLGASRVAKNPSDAQAYGSLFQWGRGSDGHQCVHRYTNDGVTTSNTTTNQATTAGANDNNPSWDGLFIKNANDWLSSSDDNLWQDLNGINNPCPSGYRLPTLPELDDEVTSWVSSNSAGAFASALKWTVAGSREVNGQQRQGTFGNYWSSTVATGTSLAYQSFFAPGFAATKLAERSNGYSLRCIKEVEPASLSTINCAQATHNGSLVSRIVPNGVSSEIAYTGGNGRPYLSQSIPSTGVTGLNARLKAGTLANGTGKLTYTFSGIPSNGGIASFAINIGGQTCTLTRNVLSPSIGSIDCNGAIDIGSLEIGISASGVSSKIPYTGGNGVQYKAQTINSTGVTGLTATLTAGTLVNGSDSLTYTISGSPNKGGMASFAINIGGQSCTLVRNVSGYAYCNLAKRTATVDVTNSITGKVWMDRNLGAHQKATSSVDPKSYGSLFQWGRQADGHQCISRYTGDGVSTSSIHTGSTANTSAPYSSQSWDAKFIAGATNWLSSLDDDLWQGANGINNPCPNGYRLPAHAELLSERNSWGSGSTINAADAFAGPLKWTVNGWRDQATGGQIKDESVTGNYWSSTVSGSDVNYLFFNSTASGTAGIDRANGFAVRCIKDLPDASVSSIDCDGAADEGSLQSNAAANGVSSKIFYTGGNGGTYATQVIASTGVTGLTATLTSGTLTNGSDTLTYTISGTPNNGGVASFAISIGGQSCTLVRSVKGYAHCNPAKRTAIVDVTNSTTGQVWMDRNLGAHQKAISSIDAKSYGSLFQWGRAADGHQCISRYNGDGVTSSSIHDIGTATTSNPSRDNTWDGKFIARVADWLSSSNNNLWQGVNGTNNPCPSGYRVPTHAELLAERNSWGSGNITAADAFAAPLKWTMNGGRDQASGGQIKELGVSGNYWSSTVSGSDAEYLLFTWSRSGTNDFDRANGFGVRCIKDLPAATLGSIDCSSAINKGHLGRDVASIGVSSKISYTGGNGGTYAIQSVASTGVSGLTATLAGGALANGSGTLTYTISGTPTKGGIASFAIGIGGQSCTLNLTVDGYIHCNLTKPTNTVDVTNATTGKVWMDRNLGAHQKATSSTDTKSYGSLFQWGREADGHQCINRYTGDGVSTSSTIIRQATTVLPNTGNNWDGKFIARVSNWLNSWDDDLWQGANGVNNPCPTGYRLPTIAELLAERNSWGSGSTITANEAFAAPLKWAMNGWRDQALGGQIRGVSTSGNYWSSTVSGYDVDVLYFTTTINGTSGFDRGNGAAVRCIKDLPDASLNSINCNGTTHNGILTFGTAASGVSSDIPYTGGNGGTYATQSFTSTGVTGLTATLVAGTLAHGAGMLTVTITGTPSGPGAASFAINIGGELCIITRNVSGGHANGCNPANSTAVVPVTSSTGKIWMDRNLGARRAAINSTDSQAYGSLFQWGRGADGHQCINRYSGDPSSTSATTSTQAIIAINGAGNTWDGFFILSNNDWLSAPDNIIWRGPNGTNNPCPKGFRLPSSAELHEERISWGSNDAPGAFTSTLKWPLAGWRKSTNGTMEDIGMSGHYWSGTASTVSSADYLFFNSATSDTNSSTRANAFSVRCIRNIASISTLNCAGATHTGHLTSRVAANGVSSELSYAGGNGETYNSQSIPSTGVTGLTAKLATGSFAHGTGTLTYNITGTPSNGGIAYFAINIGGQSCTITRIMDSPTLCNPSSPTAVVDVTNPTTGKVWMDRNLGAHQKATSSTDAKSYGSLFQWGRAMDGHQCINRYTGDGITTADTVTTKANTSARNAVNTWDGLFIISSNDWLSPADANLWQGVNGKNNPCPTGYRVPTSAELNAERLSWASDDATGALASALKWPLVGWRGQNAGGAVQDVGVSGNFWSSTVASGTDAEYLAISSSSTTTGINNLARVNGFALRCIKSIGTVSSINCGGATNTGFLTSGVAALGVSSDISYSGGNGEAHDGKTIASTGVTGLTATLAAGALANGAGSLNFIISGTPTSGGTASFAINIGGQTCTLTRTVHAPVICSSSNPTTIVAVTNPLTGKIWMDRNLGANRPATSSTDAESYGSLFQWGRWLDGHQCVHRYTGDGVSTSGQGTIAATTALANAGNNWDGLFLTRGWNDWLHTPDNNLWQGANGANNPCPRGYRIPNQAELFSERWSWSSDDAAGAFASPLKWSLAGNRNSHNGSIENVGTSSHHWSSNLFSTNAIYSFFNSSTSGTNNLSRANGFSVRCIKDLPDGAINTFNCATATDHGSLVVGVAASGVSSQISYTGGNGGTYHKKIISSTGVTGLTATLNAGVLTNGSGSLTFNITGTPSNVGLASFSIVNVGGQSCTLTRTIEGPKIGSIDCDGSTDHGFLTAGSIANGVSFEIPYTGGNGAIYQGQTVTSTGVTGLTATLISDTLEIGPGILTLSITGTPSSGGIASFAIIFGGQFCILTREVSGDPVICNPSNPTAVVDVTNAVTGKIWMDRNLGAHQQALSADDSLSYGSLFQWGRGTDGHQCVHRYPGDGVTTTGSTSIIASTAVSNANNSWDGLYIDNIGWNDWLNPYNNTLWQGASGINNPCPSGYRVPTDAELDQEMLSWNSDDAAGAFASPLRWSMAGWRISNLIILEGQFGVYWSSKVYGTGDAFYLTINNDTAYTKHLPRGNGFAVRCVKDIPDASLSSIDCNGATHNGSLSSGAPASGVSSDISYTGGNGGVYSRQTIPSTGVTGLTATVAGGQLSSGSGTLTYSISGTPSNGGKASFSIDIGGQSCTLTRHVGGRVFCNPSNPTAVVDVTNSITGKTWMDRNLGANRAATNLIDAQSYGSLFQWGRGMDGHQCVHRYSGDGVTTSATTTNTASTITSNLGNSWDGLFINSSSNDWLSTPYVNLWHGVNGINNPCPSGYRLPTSAELDAERLSWSSNDLVGAQGSPLKWSLAGARLGHIFNSGLGAYWSSTPSTTAGTFSKYLFITVPPFIANGYRDGALSVRCIKN